MQVDPEVIRGLSALGVAAIGAGWWNKRAVRNAVAEHGDHEMEHLEAIIHQLEMLRKTQAASNELSAQMAALYERRLHLMEQRLDALESVA